MSRTHTIPTAIGEIRIDLDTLGAPSDWKGPTVFLTYAHIPLLTIEHHLDRNATSIAIVGTDPRTFDQLPEPVQLAAVFWQAVLPAIHRQWRLHLLRTSTSDAA